MHIKVGKTLSSACSLVDKTPVPLSGCGARESRRSWSEFLVFNYIIFFGGVTFLDELSILHVWYGENTSLFSKLKEVNSFLRETPCFITKGQRLPALWGMREGKDDT